MRSGCVRTSGTLTLTMTPPTTLAAALSPTATTLTVADASAAQIVVGAFLEVGREVVAVTAVMGNTVSVVRAAATTQASAHEAGASIATCLAAGQQYRFSFPVANALAGQAAPSVSIAASGSASVLRTPALGDTTTVLSVASAIAGDAQAMLSRDPDFLVRDIGQTSTAPCGGFSPELFCFNTNTITVTFKANHLLVAPSRVTITGLVGAQNPDTSDSERVDAFTSGSPWTTLIEGTDAGSNTTKVASTVVAAIAAGDFLRIDEELMLVLAVASDNSTLNVLRAQGDTVTARHEARAGDAVTARHEARAVVTKEFPLYDAPLLAGFVHATGSNTSIKLNLAAPATAEYFEGYVITIDVDGDFRTTDDIYPRIAPTNASLFAVSSKAAQLFGLGGRWVKSSGTLTLQVGGSTCGESRSICELGEPGRTKLAVEMNLTVTTCVVSDAVAAGISLGSHVQIDAEVVRVDGLDGNVLTVKRGEAYTGVTSHQAGVIVAAVMAPGREYRMSFRVTNPEQVQESPFITVSASGTAGFEVAAMLKDATTLIASVGAVPGDASPLRVYRGFLNQGKDIGQSTPFPQSRNILTVTLTTNVFLATVANGFTSTVTISGLTGAAPSHPTRMPF
ncbi:hypothetical protein T484DRAFT_1800980 [Baffinella frigidus]|nr:hypothetical protein T484DRAFT_1800980 [Cryptophyta sp. CCMP2293]